MGYSTEHIGRPDRTTWLNLASYMVAHQDHFSTPIGRESKDHFVWHDFKNTLGYPYAIASHLYPRLVKNFSLGADNPNERLEGVEFVLTLAAAADPMDQRLARIVSDARGVTQQAKAMLAMFPVLASSVRFLNQPDFREFKRLFSQAVALSTVLTAAGVDPQLYYRPSGYDGQVNGTQAIIAYNLATNAAKAQREVSEDEFHLVPVGVAATSRDVHIVNQSRQPFVLDVNRLPFFPEGDRQDHIGLMIAKAYAGITGATIEGTSTPAQASYHHVLSTVRW